MRGGKGTVWEGGHRVPFIAYWPGKIEAGSHSAELAISIDVMPTILAAANVSAPADLELDGVNLLPTLTDGVPLSSRQLYWAHGKSRAMRDGDWKLVDESAGRKPPALFNLKQDLGEQRNLAKQNPEQVKGMISALNAWEREMAATATPQPATPPNLP